MIVELTVENIAIIERAQIALGPGFTVLSGETGAGKSLLVDAIELAFGARADSDLVRTGTARASVSVAVDVARSTALRALCAEQGVELDGTMLYLQREVLAEGRSQCRIAGRLAPVAALRRLGQAVVDLHGQHDHQGLLDPSTHASILDSWIGEPALSLLESIGAAHAAWDAARRRLHVARTGRREREQRVDLLKFQIDEIESFHVRPGEGEELETQLSRLQHAERLSETAFGALESLNDGEGSASERMRASLKALEESARLDPGLGSLLEPVRVAVVSLEDGVRDLRAYSEGIESDPQRLRETADRLDALRLLRRKYGDDEIAILEHLERARAELSDLEETGLDEATLEASVRSTDSELQRLAKELGALRRDRATTFSDQVGSQLRDLAMESARFEIAIEEKPVEQDGADRIGFLFSANVGEPPKPLDRIASGGEISRVMLAIKTVMAGKAGVPTLIFDEVDVGLGGRAAAVVAQKLAELGRHSQVVAITHLPQIASKANSHFRIEKTEKGGRVGTSVRLLNEEERIGEIARMIAGEEVGESARVHASEMLSGSAPIHRRLR